MSRFNLIDEQWIPVRYPNGGREALSIRDALLKAKEIAVIEDASPLVVAALHRFLLAILYRALEGPTDIEQAKMLFRSGIPEDKISAYLEHWRSRFWLFDEKFPFFQIPDFEPNSWRAWTALAAEHNADNAKVLFDHVDVNNAEEIDNAAAARWLLAAQTFAFTGNSELGYASFSPSANAAMIIPIGRHLEDTLLLCLVPENREVMKNDQPIWEHLPDTAEKLKSGITRGVSGIASLYTWPSRSIRLQVGEKCVRRIAYAAGVKIKKESISDPMLGYRIDDRNGRLPIQFHERGLWRDYDSLLPDGSHLAPMVIEHAAALTRIKRERFPITVMALGLSNVPGQAKINFWRMERFSLPQALLGDRSIRTEIHQFLVGAEVVQNALSQACRSFACDLLSRGERDPDKKDISNFLAQIPVFAGYWSNLESVFHQLLREYSLERDSDDIRRQWLIAVRDALREAWTQHKATVSTGDAWSIRALVRAEGPVARKLKELNNEISKYQPREVTP